MNKIKQWLRNKSESMKKRKIVHILDYASELYQIHEYKGQLWLTFNSCLICPADMLKGDMLETLTKIREMYAERQK